MKQLDTWLRKSLAVLTGLSMAVIVVVMLSNSISRYFFNNSFVWADSAATYAMIYGTVFGALLAYLHDLNVRFTIFTDLLPKKLLPFLNLIAHGVGLGVGLVFLPSAIGFMNTRGNILAAGLGFNMKYMQFAMVIFGVGLIMVSLIKLLETFSSLRQRSS
jgi:TRAP-type C4-dicarboxylate transport system permease small subunit